MSTGSSVGRHMFTSLAKTLLFLAAAAVLIWLLLPRLEGGGPYPTYGSLNSRVVVWIIMQVHLNFGAFVLGVPIFAMIVEIVGAATRDERYDRLAREFTRLLALAVMTTALAGVLGLAALIVFYPAVMTYMTSIFKPTYAIYAGFIICNAMLLVLYYYGWDAMKGRWKWAHIGIGVLLNLCGTAIMCVANAWVSFTMSPAGVEESGALISVAQAVQNPLWLPLNLHRLIANIAFGGAVAAAYAATRFLLAKNEEEKAHYDWMGYVGNFVAMWGMLSLLFAGYWYGKEIYAFSAEMGTTSMGGVFSWLFILQAVLIAALFIGANYYMWLGLARIPGGQRYYKFVLILEVLVILSMAVWMTPHTLVASLAESRRMGAAHHPLLGVLGLMSAKNTAANLAILTTFVSFVLYRRANKKRSEFRPSGGLGAPVFLIAISFFPVVLCAVGGFLNEGARAAAELRVLEPEVVVLEKKMLESRLPVGRQLEQLQELGVKKSRLEKLLHTPGVHHARGYQLLTVLFSFLLLLALFDMFILRGRIGDFLQWAIIGIATAIVMYYGIKGYFVTAEIRIGYSVYQVVAVLFAMMAVVAIDIFLFFGAKSLGKVEWGQMPRRSQYTLVMLAVVFTLTMGLMGFARSGFREAWHVYGVIQDKSPWSFTPTMGNSVAIATVISAIFMGLLFVIFSRGTRKKETS